MSSRRDALTVAEKRLMSRVATMPKVTASKSPAHGLEQREETDCFRPVLHIDRQLQRKADFRASAPREQVHFGVPDLFRISAEHVDKILRGADEFIQ